MTGDDTRKLEIQLLSSSFPMTVEIIDWEISEGCLDVMDAHYVRTYYPLTAITWFREKP